MNYKGYYFRIYPNVKQKELINKSLGCSRFIYNYYLNKIRNSKYINFNACCQDYVDDLKYKYPFLTEVDSIIIRKSLYSLDNSFKRYFNKVSNYPKFKSKHQKCSYSTSAIYRKYKNKEYCNIELNLQTKQIKLPKLKWIDLRGYRHLQKLDGRIINATITREANGKYYVSITCELPSINSNYIIPKNIVGIDLGIKKLITLSDGVEIENNKYILKYEKRIKRCSRELSRKNRGSKNYYKCKQKLAILYSKLKNARKYYLHSITKKITDNYDIITAEKLSLRKMIQNKNLSKKLSDASFNEIIRQLQYKSKFKGKYFYQIDSFYPSSQTCSVCGNIDSKYKNLNERIYKCCKCQNELDRDLNASINIMFEGMKLYMNNLTS